MIVNYPTLKNTIQEINSRLDNRQCFIQKIYNTTGYICCRLRFQGDSKFLYLGKGKSYEGVHVFDSPPSVDYRCKGKFQEYLRKFISNTRLTSIELDPKDRIVILNYYRYGNCHLCLFYKGRDCFVINYYRDEDGNLIRYDYAHGKKTTLSISFRSDYEEYVDSIGRKDLKSKATIKEGVTQELLLSANDQKIKKNGKIKKLKKKLKNILEDLSKCSKHKLLVEIINKSNLEGQEVVEVNGLKVKLNKNFNHFQNLDLVYKKMKALKRGEDILKKRHEETRFELEQYLKVGADIKVNKSLEPIYVGKKITPEKLENKGANDLGYKIIKTDNFKMGYGLNTKGNDNLRKNWANKEDYWFHLESYKSSHVIVKKDLIDLSDMILIGSMLRDLSKLSINEIPIVYTKVRFVKGVKGRAGAVTHKKEKYFLVNYDNKWKDLIYE